MEMIGDYRIIRQLGVGTLGTSYLTEHRFMKRQYVLKVLPRTLAQNREFVQRFESEVGRIALLEHPHIVKVYTVSHNEGLYFLVTDFFEESHVKLQSELEEEELLSLLYQVAEALDYAHAQNCVHGSLKLSNILVNRAHGKIEVALSDFGLLSVVGQDSVVGRSFKVIAETLSDRTDSFYERYSPVPLAVGSLKEPDFSFLQTYAFLAPEQKKMERATIKSDVYAFGILAYYLLTGFFPEGYFPMPSEVTKKYKFDFDSLIQATLSTDPEKRPQELCPLLQEKKYPKIEIPSVAPVVHEPESSTSFEGIKKSMESLATTVTSYGQTAPMPVKHVQEATALLNPPQDENYAQALKAMLHREPVVTHYQPEKRSTDNLQPILTEMVVIPEGHFMRGSQGGARDEMPKHQIYLKSFAIDIHPITNEQFVRFLEYVGHEKDEQYNDLIRFKDSRLHRVAGQLSIESGYAKHPVVGITWYGAVAYAKWVGKRLPTEAEWEAAAGGGVEEALYPTGMSIEKHQANFFSSDTTAVKSYAPNGFGLYDMAGNIYEWCQDWYGYNYYETSQQEPHQPLGPPQGVYRVLRGGCWKSLKDDLRIAHRHRNNPGTVNGTYGFRCAADI